VDDPNAIDRFLEDRLLGHDEELDRVVTQSSAAGLPAHHVSPLQGRMLELLARAAGARRILEIGTLGGYSTICLARALPPDGVLVTLEADPAHARVALANLAESPRRDRVELRAGRALDTLPGLLAEPPFDLVFLDADKASLPAYLDWCLRVARPGALIIADNVIRGGAIIDPDGDASATGARRFLELAGAHPRLRATAIQTVGAKGHDGFALAVVL
jgi:predicted O-methyltransferase YrrM